MMAGAGVAHVRSIDKLPEDLVAVRPTVLISVPRIYERVHKKIMVGLDEKPALVRYLFYLAVKTGWQRFLHRQGRAGWHPLFLLWPLLKRAVADRVMTGLGGRVRLAISGGAPLSPPIARVFIGLGLNLLQGYGLTETSPVVSVNTSEDNLPATVGRPYPGVEVMIADNGELLVRGPNVMLGYWQNDAATGAAIDRDGWFHTGDLALIDAAGHINITGRRKEIIVLSSGKNLYPEEIESHYGQSAFIKELCVLGVASPGEPSAERLHAVIVPDEAVLRERGVVNLRELIRFELEGQAVHLPAHKRILTYDIRMDPLPRTTTGKLRRHEIERLVQTPSSDDAPAQPRALSHDEEAWLGQPGRKELLEAISTRFAPKTIRPDDNLELDLGLDSLERVELLTTLEHRAGTRVPPEARSTMFSVRQMIEAVLGSAKHTDEGAQTSGELPWDSLLAPTAIDPELTRDLTRSKPVRTVCFFLATRVLRLLVGLIPGFKPRDARHLPRDGAFIICPNHQSYFDGFFLAASLPWHTVRRLFFVGASEYFLTAGMRRLARFANILPVDPDANLVNAMQVGVGGLRLNKVLVLFPEGERSIDGDLKKFRNGAAIMASHARVPIVPVALDGLYPLWPRSRTFQWRALLPGRSRPVHLRFGAPVSVAAAAYTDATTAVHESVGMMLGELRDIR
jgi:long-chain acyl-CoA synthetase